MTQFIIDVESDGPAVGIHSMVSFAAIVVDSTLEKTFFGEVRPITDAWVPKALAVTGYTREETLTFPEAKVVIPGFVSWVKANTKKGRRPMFMSDNNGYDFGFLTYYLWHFAGENPFGHSSHNMSDLYKGMQRDMRSSFKHLRVTPHTHQPLDDVRGNAEALLAMRAQGLKITL